MSKALEAAAKAYMSYSRHPALRSPVPMTSDLDAMRSAISAYLAHMAEDEELTQSLAEVIADAMNMNRAGRLEHEAALVVLRTLAGKE